MASATANTLSYSDSKKRNEDNPYLFPNHKPSYSLGNDKARSFQIQQSTANPPKQTNGLRKQDSLLSLMSQRSNEDNYDESPQSHEKQLMQIEKQKEENKNKMIKDFKYFIMKQHQQKNVKHNNSDLYGNQLQSNTVSYSNSVVNSTVMPSYSKIKTQNSFKIDELEQKNGGIGYQARENLPTNQSNNSESLPIQRKLMRQNTITQAINKKLKIVHKTRDQLFNEKLQLFKGVSTYIETKSYLQNLNLMNKKNLIENMKKNQQWSDVFSQLQQQKQQQQTNQGFNEEDEYESSNDAQELRSNTSFEEVFKIHDEQQEMKDKYNAENPMFEKNVNQLLDKAHSHIKSVQQYKENRYNKSMGDLDRTKLFFDQINKNVFMQDPLEVYDSTDENQFYDALKIILQENKNLQIQKQEEKKMQEIYIDQQQKQYELELLNQIYANPSITEHLSQEQIQQFIEKQAQDKFHPQHEIKENKSLTDKILLNLDLKNTNLDAKSQYQEYVEKANHIRITLKRLNENMFKQKWANALMKRKHEKEMMRNQIIKKIQNNEIEYNKVDALFPSKKKMKHIRSKVNSNLSFANGGYVVRSNSIEESPDQTVKEFFPTQVEGGAQSNMNNHQSHRSSHDIHSTTTLTLHDGTKAYSTRDVTMVPNSLKYIEIKESARQKEQKQTYYYQTPSGYVRQVTKVDLTDEEKQKKQEQFEKQQLKKQQEQLKKDILSNISHFNAKKSSAPCLSIQELPKIKSTGGALNSPTLSSSSKDLHLIKPQYGAYKKDVDLSKNGHTQTSQFYMRSTSKASSLIGTPSQKEIDLQLSTKYKSGKSLNNLVKTSNNFKYNNIRSFHSSQVLSPTKINDKSVKSPEKFAKSTVYSSSTNNLDPSFDVSTQKSQLFTILTNLEQDNKSRRKENKEISQKINEIQTNCTSDLTKLSGGNKIGSVKDILDIDFLKFSMKKNQHIRDTNIKNFLNKNN